MSDVRRPSFESLRRLNVALIPVLAVVLGAILWWPAQATSEAAAEPSAAGSTAQMVERADKLPGGDPRSGDPRSGDPRTKPNWPTAGLADALAFNPFEPFAESPVVSPAPSEGDESPSEQDPDLIAATSSNQKVGIKIDVIYETAGERVAVVNSRIVRVGDDLTQGRVVEITPTDIVVELGPHRR